MSKQSTTVKLISIVCTLVVVGGLGIGVKGKVYRVYKKGAKIAESKLSRANIADGTEEIPDKEKVYEFVEHYIEQYSRNTMAIIEMIRQDVEYDSNKRYMVKMKVVGSEAHTGLGVYEYFVMVYKDQDEYRVMPLGIEVLKNNNDPLKHDLTKSMLKIANGWGLTQEQNQEKCQILLEETGKMNLEELSQQQRIVKLIEYTMRGWMRDINNENEMIVELVDLEIGGIERKKNSNKFVVEVQGELVICTKTMIERAEICATIDISENNKTLKVIDYAFEINKDTKK